MDNSFGIDNLGECKFDSPSENIFFADDTDGVLVDATLKGNIASNGSPEFFEEAGPRKKIFFNPAKSRVAIVTCGGLCPGLNDVIRGLTMVLWYRYGIKDILGLKYGFESFIPTYGHIPLQLTPHVVEDIHKDGGTILGSSRGPQEPADQVDFLIHHGINILFVIGGDGTQRGGVDIANIIEERGLPISVVGIPKTIDNDLLHTERTFGFETAVAMAQLPITCAHREATAAYNGIGLVKLMGRESGFVAACSTLASSDVNLVLVPEVDFSLPRLFAFLKERIISKDHAMIVVAEGAGQNLLNASGKDASGNSKLADIGVFLKDEIAKYFKSINMPSKVIYIDPSYTIRSAPANANDSGFCFQLAEHAVHAAMTGRTKMFTSYWNGHFVHIPTDRAAYSRKTIDPEGTLWQSVLDDTGQPIDLS